MRVLVTGAGGQLGGDVMRCLRQRGMEAIGTVHKPGRGCTVMDLTREDQVQAVLQEYRPEAVIHCAAWTDVDGAERQENREQALQVNAGGTEVLARACGALGCKLAYVSTDYVFDGSGKRPWRPEDPAGPLSVYGEGKLAGETAVCRMTDRHFIVRTSWLFGPEGKCFPDTMLRLGAAGRTVSVVDDQIGRPTYSPDLAELLCAMIATERYGTYHASGEGAFVSWAGFAETIFRRAGLPGKVRSVSTEEYGKNLARRPKNSRLDCSSLTEKGFRRLPDWQDALGRFLRQRGYKE